MKKARVMLSAIAVVAVVGGTLAFTAARYNGNRIFTDPNGTGNCTVQENNLLLTNTSTAASILVSDQSGTSNCVQTYTKPDGD